MKSSYNERFAFDNPLTQLSASRAMRYRVKKKRVAEEDILDMYWCVFVCVCGGGGGGGGGGGCMQ